MYARLTCVLLSWILIIRKSRVVVSVKNVVFALKLDLGMSENCGYHMLCDTLDSQNSDSALVHGAHGGVCRSGACL